MMLTTVDEVIAHYGGVRAASRHFGYASHATVLHWRKNERIPSHMYFRISRELEQQQIEIDQRIFDNG